MERQRRSALKLVRQEKQSALKQVEEIPMPVLLGIALVSGFLVERLWHYPNTSQLIRLAIAYRAF
ncbi:hypothetical protein AWR36_012435 [Microbulbifer flavimaris]|uniref:Uncharacterized protein n=1 Tax=Microbulbifer flavimaris TaxID=1781068 RepID=A0ABX4HXE6_9GAMM|nr:MULTISPECIES: hypothetical protein [Microbulbifer]KUJ82587.1 hypothetical protein AVO43_12400 [Microbulbifer sp. ZGT114]PCO04797.1 hypothetical protein AWR36_012435 [Microbulbifer flavimaris]